MAASPWIGLNAEIDQNIDLTSIPTRFFTFDNCVLVPHSKSKIKNCTKQHIPQLYVCDNILKGHLTQ